MNFVGTEQEKRDLILKIAKSKVGIKENPPNSNNVIFNTLFYGREVHDGDKLGATYPWCGTSVSEVFQEALLPLGTIDYRRGYAGCPYALQHLDKWGKEVSFEDAQPGDIIFYDWNLDKKFDHTGILECKNVLAKAFKAYEGNTAVGNDSNGGEFMYRPRTFFAGVKFVRPNIYG